MKPSKAPQSDTARSSSSSSFGTQIMQSTRTKILDLLDPMIWVPNILPSLELQRNCANLIVSGRPSFAVAWQSPCTPHTCRHIDHHHQNSRSTDHWPTKWSYSGEDLTVGAKRNLIFLFAPTVRSSPEYDHFVGQWSVLREF